MKDYFKTLLEKGNTVEDHFMRLFRKKGYIVTKNESKDKARLSEYDFSITGTSREVYFEVKSNTRVGETGSFTIEVASYDGPSGLSVTTADYYILASVDLNIAYFVEVEVLKAFVKHMPNIRGGYNKYSVMKLVKHTDIALISK